MDDVHDVARAASAKARHVETREAHLRAVDALHQSAKMARAEGHKGLAERHQRRADAHAKRAKELTGKSSSSGAAAPSTDTPDQGNADPLITWMSTPRGG